MHVPDLSVALARAIVKAPGLQFLQALLIDHEADEEKGELDAPTQDQERYMPGPDIPDDAEYATAAYHVLARFPHFESVRRFRLGNDDDGGYDNRKEPFLSQEGCSTEGSFAHHFVKQMPHVEEIVLRARRVDTAKLFALPKKMKWTMGK